MLACSVRVYHQAKFHLEDEKSKVKVKDPKVAKSFFFGRNVAANDPIYK